MSERHKSTTIANTTLIWVNKLIFVEFVKSIDYEQWIQIDVQPNYECVSHSIWNKNNIEWIKKQQQISIFTLETYNLNN